MSKTIVAKVILNPSDKTEIILLNKSAPVLIGADGLNDIFYECGQCGKVIAIDIDPQKPIGQLIKCFYCGSYNSLE